jgi:aspartate aminotransferase
MVKMIGGNPIMIPCDSADNFRITAAKLREYLSSKTKAIMINTPSNPTGRVLSVDEIQALADVAKEADLYVVSDEIYEKVIFDGRTHISIASQAGMAERTITVNGMSKAFAMTGWRMGWLAGPTPVIKIANIFNTQTVTSAATFTMIATIAALNGDQSSVEVMRQAYQNRRDFIVNALNEIDGIDCRSIEGTFYVFPHFPNTDKTSSEIAETILQKAQVAGVPGTAFGESGAKHIRFSIATDMAQLEKAVERIAAIASEI